MLAASCGQYIARAFAQLLDLADTTALLTSSQCRVWFDVLGALQANLFDGARCGDQAREAIRLTFHDGIGRSASLDSAGSYGGGGADGSIIAFAAIELTDPANLGLEDAVYALKHFADSYDVGYGDIIQFAGAIALANCPGSPRLAFYAGRPPAVAPSPRLIPAPFDPVEKILTRMADAGFTADETVALLAAHSLAVQKSIDPSIPFIPLDSTPNTFDTQFYLETLLQGTGYPGKVGHRGEAKSPSSQEFRVKSDDAFARHPATACRWQSFVNDQSAMQAAFRDAMLKLANQGHTGLVDCSHVIPTPTRWDGETRYPFGKGPPDVQQTCLDTTFPALMTSDSLNNSTPTFRR